MAVLGALQRRNRGFFPQYARDAVAVDLVTFSVIRAVSALMLAPWGWGGAGRFLAGRPAPLS